MISSTMNDIGNEDNSISGASPYSFQWSLISYALHHERIFFIDNAKMWEDFCFANADDMFEHSPEELRDRFLHEVLPQIFIYDLNEMEKNLLNLLELHPSFRRTENGLIKTDEYEQIDMHREIPDMDDRNYINPRHDDLILPRRKDLECQVVIAQHEAIQLSDRNQLSKENATLLSIALCPEADLPVCRHLSTEEMHKYLREAKLQFERNGQQLINIDCNTEDLLEKSKTVSELKEVVTKLVGKQK